MRVENDAVGSRPSNLRCFPGGTYKGHEKPGRMAMFSDGELNPGSVG